MSSPSGNLAMAETHSWYMCCINPAAPAKRDFEWGVAVAPSYNGTTTAKLHADTFSLLKSTKHPEEAFKALTVLVNSGALLADYGAFPADPSQAGRVLRDRSTSSIPDVTIDWAVPRRCCPTRTSPTTRPTCRTTPRPRRPSGPRQRVSDESARHRRRADEAADGRCRASSTRLRNRLAPPATSRAFSSAREVDCPS